MEAAMATVMEEFGRLDVLVTAAGIPRRGYRAGTLAPDEVRGKVRAGADARGSFLEASLEDWTEVLAVNLTGTFLAVQAAARRMKAGAAIVTIASVAAKQPGGDTPSYSVSKAGVWMLTKFAAQALAPSGIRVNCVAPGFLETNQTAALRAVPELAAAALARVPMGRFGRADDVARTIVFLAGDEAPYTTGEMFHVDGGFYTE
jgi:3-oxoacyl-[acyl-carrier protein] reductase